MTNCNRRCRRGFGTWVLFVSFLLATPTTTVLARAVDDVKNKKINENDTNAADESIKHSTSNTPSTTTTTTTKTPDTSFTEQSIRIAQKKVQQDRANQMKNYWKRTFAEIKDLQVFFPETSPLLTQWKLLLDDGDEVETNANNNATVSTVQDDTLLSDDPTTVATISSSAETTTTTPQKTTRKPRFDGFRSWDRLLQEWADDVADYIERNSAETDSYPMSTFGRPSDYVLVGEEQEDDIQLLTNENATNEEIPSSSTTTSTTSSSSSSSLSQDATQSRTIGIPSRIVSVVPKSKKSQEVFVPRPVRPGEAILPHTDISDKSKSIWIVTTASLPWMTGTAVNALLRAAYLTNGRKQAGGKVTLMLPWLENRVDQEKVYGKDRAFDTVEDQEEYVRTWLRETAAMKDASEELNIAWYPARQEPAENSIYSMGDITALVPADEVDICILEEPEHLNWYRAPEQPAAFVRAPAMRLLCSWMCRAHCHRVIKLSGTLGKFAPEKELVENVHGVRGTFLEIGEEVRQILDSKKAKDHPVFAPDAKPTVYFIGKMLWSKGLGSLMELLKYAEESADLRLHVDMYGGGPDKDAAEKKSKKLGVDLQFHGPVDHAKLALSHKVFVNPSTSEVLCTTVAEALAMGKFVVLPSHPSNDFFAQFPNCLPYTNKEEFVGNLYYALTHSPAPLTKEYAHALSWAAATERLEAAGSISVEEAERMAEVMESRELGVEIDLPPLIDDDARRRKIASTFRLSRARYRQFRSRLSEEIKQSKVLPKELQRLITMELDRRLDLDIDTVLESPKLRIQLSPAELDKRLLKFYTDVTRSPSGDALRVIGGGTNVGMQNLYMKKQAQKQRRRERHGRGYDPAFNLPAFTDDVDEINEEARTATQWVTLALRRNLPSKTTTFTPKQKSIQAPKDNSSTKMMMMMKATPMYVAKLPTRKMTSSPLI